MVHALYFSIVRAKSSHEKVTLANWDRFIIQIMLDNSPSNDIIHMDYAGACVVRRMKKFLMERHRWSWGEFLWL